VIGSQQLNATLIAVLTLSIGCLNIHGGRSCTISQSLDCCSLWCRI